MPDYTFKPNVDIASLARLIAQKPVEEQQMRLQQEQIASEKQNRTMQIVNMASQLVQGLTQYAAKKQMITAGNALGQVLANGNTPVPTDQMIPAKSTMVPKLNQAPLTVPFSQTPDYKDQLMSLTAKSNPKEFMDQISKEAASSLFDNGTMSLQAKSVTLDGVPAQANYNPKNGKYYAPDTGQELTGNIQPMTISSPLAEVRRQQLVNTMSQQLVDRINPANFKPGTTSGRAVSIVRNSDSAISLADQMLNKEVPITEQNMTTLAMDVNRVISQTGTTSEKTTAELKQKTGFSTFANATAYFTNHPQDQKLDKFVDILKKEMVRQRDLNQLIVDRTIAGNLPASNELKKLDPETWATILDANGIDAKAAKKGHYKMKAEWVDSLYGTKSPTSKSPTESNLDLSIDQNAINAELKRRGL